MVKISVIKTFQKVNWVFENGQKKMSKIENPKKVLKRTLFFGVCDQNALNSEKITQKSVTIIFLFFCENHLETFSNETIWNKMKQIYRKKSQ
jgi:hypothetical protein